MRKPFETADISNYAILKAHAKKNRQEPTAAESFLWEHLRGDSLGLRFRRQYIVGNYIVDFISLKAKLVIEVDGEYHNESEQQRDDAVRSDYLLSRGFRVIRFSNEDVLHSIGNVLETIKKEINNVKR